MNVVIIYLGEIPVNFHFNTADLSQTNSSATRDTATGPFTRHPPGRAR